jgi:hypothetical protein
MGHDPPKGSTRAPRILASGKHQSVFPPAADRPPSPQGQAHPTVTSGLLTTGEAVNSLKASKGPRVIRAARTLQRRLGNALVQQIVTDRSPGRPLPRGVRRDMEALLGEDLTRVRIHTDANAAKWSKALRAKAFTQGQQVYFSTTGYQPDTLAGRHLLAHELTHTLQGPGGDRGQVDRTVIAPPDHDVERTASRTATNVAARRPSRQQAYRQSPFLIHRSPESEFISSHTSWGNLDEEALGRDLLVRALGGEHGFVRSVFTELGATDRDDVALAFMQAARPEQLAQMCGSDSGRALLDRLFDELTSGSVADEETLQANRIMQAKAQLIPRAEFGRQVEQAKVFPYRAPGVTVLDDAPISAERRAGGRIWVKLPVRVMGTDKFRAEVRTLPTEVFIGGVELPENEIVGVKMYDLGGEVHYRPALYLVQVANETDRAVLEAMGTAAGLGLALVPGAVAGTAAGAGWLARAVVWADRIATGIGTIATLIREHRGWIIEKFGDGGRQFVHYVDIVNSVVAIYGGGKALVGMGQLLVNLSGALRNWRRLVGQAANLTDEERAIANAVTRQCDDIVADAERAGAQTPAGASTEAVGAAPAHGGGEVTIPEPAGGAPPAAASTRRTAIEDRLAEVEAQLAAERTRVADVRGELTAEEWARARAGLTKPIYNLAERRYVLRLARAFPGRRYIEQAEIVGVLHRGELVPTSTIAGRGRVADWAEVGGAFVQLGDIKSPSTQLRSVQGGLAAPGIEGQFRSTSEIARQHAVERTLLDYARSHGDRVLIRGRDPLSGASIEVWVDAERVKASVITDYNAFPNN